MAYRIAGDVVSRIAPPPPPGAPPELVLAAVLAERHRRELARLRPAPSPMTAPAPWPPAGPAPWPPAGPQPAAFPGSPAAPPAAAPWPPAGPPGHPRLSRRPHGRSLGRRKGRLLPGRSKGHSRIPADSRRPASYRSGYWATVAAMTATSATKSAHPHSGTTMPPCRFAVKNDMTMTTKATAGAP